MICPRLGTPSALPFPVVSPVAPGRVAQMDEKPEGREAGKMDDLVRAADDVADRAAEIAAEAGRLVALGRQLREELRRSGDGEPDR